MVCIEVKILPVTLGICALAARAVLICLASLKNPVLICLSLEMLKSENALGYIFLLEAGLNNTGPLR